MTYLSITIKSKSGYLEFNTQADYIEKQYLVLRKAFNNKIDSQNFVILMESEAGKLPFF